MADVEKFNAMNEAIKQQYDVVAHNSTDMDAKFILEMMIADREMYISIENTVNEAEQILHDETLKNIRKK